MTFGLDLPTLALICVLLSPIDFNRSISRITLLVSLRMLLSPLQWSSTIVKDGSQGVNMPPERVLTCRRIHCKHVAGLGVNMSSEYAQLWTVSFS